MSLGLLVFWVPFGLVSGYGQDSNCLATGNETQFHALNLPPRKRGVLDALCWSAARGISHLSEIIVVSPLGGFDLRCLPNPAQFVGA